MSLVTPGIGLLFWMLVSFSILLFILKKFAWRPILGSIKAREKSIEEALRSAEVAREEMAKITADNQKVLDEARKQSEIIIREAKDLGIQLKEEAKKQADDLANKLMETAKKQIQAEKQAAIVEMKNEIAKLSVQIASKVIKTELASNDKQMKFINDSINDIELN
jgi:F-type H+-transporting ATPase subunit b